MLIIAFVTWFAITPSGERTKPLLQAKEWWKEYRSTPTPTPLPTPAPTLPYVIPADKLTVGGMQSGDVGYTYPGAIVVFGEHQQFLDPASAIKKEATTEYPIRVERKADGFYVKNGRKFTNQWRRFNSNAAVSMNLEPIMRLE